MFFKRSWSRQRCLISSFFFKWKIFKILNHIWKLIRISCLKMNFTLLYKINLLQYSPRITVVNRNFFAVCFPFPHLTTIAKKRISSLTIEFSINFTKLSPCYCCFLVRVERFFNDIFHSFYISFYFTVTSSSLLYRLRDRTNKMLRSGKEKK